VLVDDGEAARIAQPLDPRTGLIPRNAGSIIENAKGRSFSAFTVPSSFDFLDEHVAVLDPLDAGVGHPLDVLLAHLAFQQALGVAHPVQPQMPDIGFGVTKVIGTLSRILALRSAVSRMNRNS
jgi:hypothetical protein